MAIRTLPLWPSAIAAKLIVVSDEIAVWGAVTGTVGTLSGLGSLAYTVLRERRARKRGLLVSHGWQYACDPDGNVVDVWVNVTAFNTGSRPLHIEYVGFEALIEAKGELADRVAADAGIQRDPDRKLWVNLPFEIALNTETLEVAPDGPSVKVWTRLVPMCAHPFDPTETELRAFVVTWPEMYWWEEVPQPLLAEPLEHGDSMASTASAVEALAEAELGPNRTIQPYRPGRPVALQRLMLDGSVERTSDLFPDLDDSDASEITTTDEAASSP